VKITAIPHFEGLTVQDFLDYARKKPSLLKFLPDERDWERLEKHWICDLLYTLDEEGIQGMIDEALVFRKEKLELSRDLTIPMKPEFIKAL